MKGNQGCYTQMDARCQKWVALNGSKTETAQCMRTRLKGYEFCKQHTIKEKAHCLHGVRWPHECDDCFEAFRPN